MFSRCGVRGCRFELRNVGTATELQYHREEGHDSNCSRVIAVTAFTLTTGQRTPVTPRCSQGNPKKIVLFVAEKQPTSIGIEWSEPVFGLESRSIFAAHFFANYRAVSVRWYSCGHRYEQQSRARPMVAGR